MNKLNLDVRELIAMGIARNQPLKKIAKYMNRNVSSISREIKKHRILDERISKA